MTAIVEGRHTGEFILTPATGLRSMDNITLAANVAALPAGTILGQTTVGAGTSAAKAGGNTGNATMSAITVAQGAVSGIYTVRMTAATTFVVENPDGDVIGSGDTGVAFSDDIGFTMTVGGTPMVAGDGFNVTVAAGSGAYIPVDPASTVGANVASAILYDNAPISVSARVVAAVTRDCEVNGAIIAYPSGASAPQKAVILAALTARGIVVRPPAV